MASRRNKVLEESPKERDIFYTAWRDLINSGIEHPAEKKFFLEALEYYRSQVQAGIQKFYATHPQVKAHPEASTGAELEAWKVAQRRFESSMDLLKLEVGADVRVTKGYATVRDWLARGIEDLEALSKRLKVGRGGKPSENPKAWGKPMTQTEMAKKLNITPPTLRKRLKENPKFGNAIQKVGRKFRILNGMIPVLRDKLKQD